MESSALPAGTVHELPDDLGIAVREDDTVRTAWEAITPLARNEWICWIEDAKKAETRSRRIARAEVELAAGKRRPCCWPGCSHRERNGK